MAKNLDRYARLHELSKTNATLASIESLISWDQETYMPPGAIEFRGLQTEMIASLVHKARTSPGFVKALSSLIDLKTGEILDSNLSPPKVAALREWRRDYLKASKLPASFVKKFAKTTSEAIHIWSIAKEKNSFAQFAPHLEKIVDLNRKKAEYLGFKEHPYDALLDLFEPNMTIAKLTPLFGRLKIALTSLLKEISARPVPRDDFLFDHFPAAKQIQFGHLLLKTMGFDNNTSRLDLSHHPFCMGIHPKDTRLTTRIHPTSVMSNIFAVIHEGGHGLYNIGLPAEHFGSPLCESASLAVDESQSRWWETRIGHSLPFWKHFFPQLKNLFPERLGGINLDDFYAGINIVKPSLIRIEADEVTYSLHIIIRFEIEKALIEGTLSVKDVPQAWNAKVREYLGITPPNDSEGCLQDIHWSMGAIGYFPTYTLGNLYAAQFFAVFEKAHPDWQARIAEGDLAFMVKWLRDNIHQYGRQYTPDEIVKKITGRELSEEPYVNYLNKKFKEIYHLPK